MNKAELVEAVAKKTDLSKAEVDRTLKLILETIKKGVKKEGTVQLIGFGTFNMVKRKARMGRNPQTGEELKIKASKSVGFKVGKAFKGSL
jgi:nucleoid DNA-binding protein